MLSNVVEIKMIISVNLAVDQQHKHVEVLIIIISCIIIIAITSIKVDIFICQLIVTRLTSDLINFRQFIKIIKVLKYYR